jgi:hypothetical protein
MSHMFDLFYVLCIEQLMVGWFPYVLNRKKCSCACYLLIFANLEACQCLAVWLLVRSLSLIVGTLGFFFGVMAEPLMPRPDRRTIVPSSFSSSCEIDFTSCEIFLWTEELQSQTALQLVCLQICQNVLLVLAEHHCPVSCLLGPWFKSLLRPLVQML